MKLALRTPGQILNKAYARQAVRRDDMERFRKNLENLFRHLSVDEGEEHLKNYLADFLKDTWYKQTNLVNTSDRIDLAIYAGLSPADPVAVIMETKAPANRQEMMTPEKPNVKAFHEIILYYLRQVVEEENHDIKHLVVTNTQEWFVFDGVWFEEHIRRNHKLIKLFKELKPGGYDNRHFYEDVLRPWLEDWTDPIPCCHFNLREYEPLLKTTDDAAADKLLELLKLFSPQNLLKQPFSNDSNFLNRAFYDELLHIIGLEEVKEKGKKLIRRKTPGRRADGTLLENAINQLRVQHDLDMIDNAGDDSMSEEDRLFSIALELCITWLNRILFLKLLEGRLIAWNRGDSSFAFLNKERIRDFDDLQELFFEVLARRQHERPPGVAAKFGTIPYLNSSLFEMSDLERQTIRISNLKQRLNIPLFSGTVLKDDTGKRQTGHCNTLHYLFAFLDAYDFASEGKAQIKEAPKTIINASVLGLIFEKINGYRDGSFYTPGYITMYMSRESLRRAVTEKFNTHYGWKCAGIKEIYNRIDPAARSEADALINSLRICDPAVGSGHFLVSALNEIIAVKAELHILADKDGKLLRGYAIAVENDELTIEDENGPFVYRPGNAEAQRVQETLFREKATIIENCLFGVDINPKSVSICRLRLWIELLKNAYYRHDEEDGNKWKTLETLPNIDINIKCGNSLVSRFALSDNGSELAQYAPSERRKIKNLTKRYQEKVWLYKLGAEGPRNKHLLRREIESLKEQWQSLALPADWYMGELRKVNNQLAQTVFAFDEVGRDHLIALRRRAEDLEQKIAERRRTVYAQAFEWRFEFPEVLNEDGEFAGFDVLIGNPPYGIAQPKELKDRYVTFALRGESYVLFVERALELLKGNGQFTYIIPDTYLNLSFTAPLRDHLLHQSRLRELVLLPTHIFEDATVDTTLLFAEKASGKEGLNETMVRIKGFDKHRRRISLDDPDELSFHAAADWRREGSFNVRSNAAAVALMDRIRSQCAKLGDVAELYSGIKVYEVGKGKPPQTAAIRAAKPFTSVMQTDDRFRPFFDGRHIGRYALLWKGDNWLNYGPWLAAPRNSENFVGEKILIRKIVAATLIAAYIPETSYCNTLLHLLKVREGCNLSYRFLLGVLNSRFIGWYFRNRFQISAADTFPQIMIADIQQLPLPDVSPTRQAPVIALVDEILARKKTDPQADIRELDEALEALITELYGLTEEELTY